MPNIEFVVRRPSSVVRRPEETSMQAFTPNRRDLLSGAGASFGIGASRSATLEKRVAVPCN
jgi:hypothetical protein